MGVERLVLSLGRAEMHNALDAAAIEHVGRDARNHAGAAAAQVDWFVRAVLLWRERFPAAAKLKAEPIL